MARNPFSLSFFFCFSFSFFFLLFLSHFPSLSLSFSLFPFPFLFLFLFLSSIFPGADRIFLLLPSKAHTLFEEKLDLKYPFWQNYEILKDFCIQLPARTTCLWWLQRSWKVTSQYHLSICMWLLTLERQEIKGQVLHETCFTCAYL